MSAGRIDTQELNAFVDGELDLARQLAIEARLADEPALQAEVDALRELRHALRDRADYHPMPVDVLARLPWSAVAAAEPASPALPTATAGWRRWFAWRPLLPAFALAGLALWGLNLGLLAPPGDDPLLREVIASHVRSTVGQKLVDVASSDRHTVKPWLSARLDYSPPVADAPVPGAVFLGGRIDYLDNRPVAALVYRQRQHVIDAYIWPVAGADSSPTALSSRGFNTLHWVRGGMRFWLVSDINRDELAAFAQAVEQADAAR